MKEVNAMTSIRSKHTVPLFGIMFGVQGQEDSLGLNIGIRLRVFPAAKFFVVMQACRWQRQTTA